MKMAKTICLAKKTGQVKIRGKASIEWYDDDENPHYYCHGYFDCSNEELLPVCKDCVDNVIFAQRDLEQAFSKLMKGKNYYEMY